MPRRSRRPARPHLRTILRNGVLLGNWRTFSILMPQSGHQTRFTPTITIVRNSMHGRSRTSRSLASFAPSNLRPQLGNQLSIPRLRCIYSLSVFARLWISCRLTR